MRRTGGIPYNSPKAVAYREAWLIEAMKVGHEDPDTDKCWALALQIEAARCDFPQDVDADGDLTHAECACPQP